MDDAVWKQTWGEALNQQQAAAVQAADGPVLLLAVPGSGKTTVLIHRLGYLMDCRGIPPERILTVTYTVAATRDMRARSARPLYSWSMPNSLFMLARNCLALSVS